MSDSTKSTNNNVLSHVGGGVLCGAATWTVLVSLSVAPKTTIGLTALGCGLLAAGNTDRLSAWSDATFGG